MGQLDAQSLPLEREISLAETESAFPTRGQDLLPPAQGSLAIVNSQAVVKLGGH